jgi:hypothetical protein
MNNREELNEKYFLKFGYHPDAEFGYNEPTESDLLKAIETGIEFDFYEGMPEGAKT